MDSPSNKSVFSLAASSGLPVGLYFCVMSFCLMMTMKSAVANIVLLGMLFIFPFILYRMMKRVATAFPAYAKLMPLWVYGIYTIIFGTLICALFTACYIYFLYPSFIPDLAQSLLDALKAYPAGAVSPGQLQVAEDFSRIAPRISPMQLVVSGAWSSCFWGCILSCPLAMLARRRPPLSNN